MGSENINNSAKKRILIAPLDWGLGHTTRIIPIIRLLIEIGVVPIIAGDKNTRTLLEKEFPRLTYVYLKGYNIQYGKYGSGLMLKLLAQGPKVVMQLLAENIWVKKAVKTYDIDGIISDNRPSFYHQKIPSVYITHQLQVFSPIRFIRNMARKMHYKFINKFMECWVPDFAGANNLAGSLSHPEELPQIPVKYMGPISRFTADHKEPGGNIVAILSGPEPQRSMLEDMLTKILKQHQQLAILIIGKPGKESLKSKEGNLTVYNHLETETLEQVLKSAKLIIARAGYSTIMDLLYLQKSAILIPTPGQSEQEYLAEHLGKRREFVFVKQNEADITRAIKTFQKTDPKIMSSVIPSFETTVINFINGL